MNSLFLFIPLVVCLLLALGGLTCAIVAAVLLKKTSVAHRGQPPQGSQPPLLPGATLRPAASRRFWTLCLKSLFVLGLAAFVAGLLGAWSTGVSFGYLKANMHPEGQPLEHALRESHQVLAKEDEHTAFGMNWIHLHGPKLKQPIIWHNGGTGGFRSFLGFTEDSRFGVQILSNTSEDVDSLALALLRDLAIEPPRPDQH